MNKRKHDGKLYVSNASDYSQVLKYAYLVCLMHIELQQLSCIPWPNSFSSLFIFASCVLISRSSFLIFASCSFIIRVRDLASKAPDISLSDWACNNIQEELSHIFVLKTVKQESHISLTNNYHHFFWNHLMILPSASASRIQQLQLGVEDIPYSRPLITWLSYSSTHY